MQIVFLSVVFGLFHGLVFLPVVLALFGQSEDEAGASANADADNDAPDRKGGAKLSRQNSDIEDNAAAAAVNNNKTQS